MYLVTGATGLLGNCIVRELISRRQRVRVFVRGASQRPELAGLDVEVFTGELHDAAALQRAVDGCQAVIHSAALIHIGYGRLDESRRVNVEGTRRVAAACRQSDSRLVYISTVDTLPAAVSIDEPVNEMGTGVAKTPCTYVISKTEAEAVVSQACSEGQEAVIVHPGFMLAPYDWKPSSGAIMRTVFRSPLLIVPRGTASVCDARDVAASIAEAVDRGRIGEHYILAGENISYLELCKRMLSVMGRTKPVIRMGPIAPAAACLVDFWNRTTGRREGLFNGAAIAMGKLHHAYDSSKARRELNYSNRPLDETLRDAWGWLHEHFDSHRFTG